MNDYRILEFNGNNREFINPGLKDINRNDKQNNGTSFELKEANLYRCKKPMLQWKDNKEIKVKRKESKDDSDLFNLYLHREHIKLKDKEKDDISFIKTKKAKDDSDLFNLLCHQTDIKKKNEKDIKANAHIKESDLFEVFSKFKQEENEHSPDNGLDKDGKLYKGLNSKHLAENYSWISNMHIVEEIFSDKKPIVQPKQKTFESYTESKVYPINYISPNIPEEDLHAQIDATISKWSHCSASDKKSLICLLSSLNEVWTTDPMLWDNISTEELINSKSKLRTVYKQAMLQLHCDKNATKDEKTKYIAKSLYQIVNEAFINYNKYL